MRDAMRRPGPAREPEDGRPQRCASCAAKHISFCAELDPATQSRFDALVDRIRLPKGEVIASEGAAGVDIFTVVEGAVMLSKSLPGGRRQVIGFRFPGDLITVGLRQRAWPVTARAIVPSEVCRIGCGALRDIAKTHPELALALLDAACDEIAHLQEYLLTVGRKRTDERVATFLLEMGRRIQGGSGKSGEILLPMHRPEIADYLGLKTETVSRVLSRWRKDGIVELPHPSHVVLRDPDRLADLAAGRLLSRRR